MAYSPQRHGIVVVKTNSVNISPIKVSVSQANKQYNKQLDVQMNKLVEKQRQVF